MEHQPSVKTEHDYMYLLSSHSFCYAVLTNILKTNNFPLFIPINTQSSLIRTPQIWARPSTGQYEAVAESASNKMAMTTVVHDNF